MPDAFQYAAFISYSSKDAAFAARLHRALEGYGIPASLGQFHLLGEGGRANRIYPVFRDREELSAGGLSERIEAGLRASAALIVVCSPHAAASPWVQKEIEVFASLGRRGRVFAIIADDAGANDAACFPPALRGEGEPLAADAREGKDGFRNAWLKLVAGLIGVSPGQIMDRDRARRRRNAAAIAAASAAFAAALSYSAWQALRPVSLAACSSDRLTFADAWGGSTFRVERVGRYERRVCEGGPECLHQLTVFEGAYDSAPGEGESGRVFYLYAETPRAAPCCTWDAARTLEPLGAELTGPDFHWFPAGAAPRLSTFPFSSIELDDVYAPAAVETAVAVTRNPLIARSCRQRGLF